MKNTFFAALTAASLLFTGQSGLAAEASAAATELKALVTKVQTKLKEARKTEDGKTKRVTEADLADELKEFDALLAKHQGEKTDDVAQILYTKHSIYSQVLMNKEKGAELMKQLRAEFGDTKLVANIIKQEERQAEAKKIQDALAVGSKFPDFDEKDLAGKPLSIANYKGKVVLIDFWATWCPPCVKELPNVLEAYEKHHGKGFEIIGISLDRDQSKLEKFIQEKKMPWQQFFDGEGWGNKLSTKYGVNSIPATYLLDGEGKIIGKNLGGEALEAAVAKALAKS